MYQEEHDSKPTPIDEFDFSVHDELGYLRLTMEVPRSSIVTESYITRCRSCGEYYRVVLIEGTKRCNHDC